MLWQLCTLTLRHICVLCLLLEIVSSFQRSSIMIRYSRTRDEALRSMKTDDSALVGQRIVARSRTFSSDGVYGAWTIHRIENPDDSERKPILFKLRCGGCVTFFPTLVNDCSGIYEEMDSCTDYRQFKIQGVHKEPRLHVLFSSMVTEESRDDTYQPGYNYHNITMRALPLSPLKRTSEVAELLARKMLPKGKKEWNIGLDMLLYRDGRDGINWHADDTQSEDTILSLVVHSDDNPRTICIRPSGTIPEVGDQIIELFPGVGDAYLFDALSQKSTEHAILTTQQEVGKRMTIIFRNGELRTFQQESSFVLGDKTIPDRSVKYAFGNFLTEFKRYSRTSLFTSGGHRNDRGGVAGNKTEGCASVIINKVDSRLGEKDEFDKIVYFVRSNQGNLSVLKSYQDGLPVRVFRSGNGNSPYKPLHCQGNEKYRYDGIYFIEWVEDVTENQEKRKDYRFGFRRAMTEEEYKQGSEMKNDKGLDLTACAKKGAALAFNNKRCDIVDLEPQNVKVTVTINGSKARKRPRRLESSIPTKAQVGVLAAPVLVTVLVDGIRTRPYLPAYPTVDLMHEHERPFKI